MAYERGKRHPPHALTPAHLSLQNLDPFSSLRILSIQSNRLTKLENLNHLTSLEELYVSHNGLKVIEGLSELKKLRVLDVGGNKIEAIGGLEGLTELEEFWVSRRERAKLARSASQAFADLWIALSPLDRAGKR